MENGKLERKLLEKGAAMKAMTQSPVDYAGILICLETEEYLLMKANERHSFSSETATRGGRITEKLVKSTPHSCS